ncbi:MAG: hypothetical protein WBE34_18535 [Candidatus Nitrosopolaris sp.]
MGRTIPSFRLASVKEEREWNVFRNSLDKSDRKLFDMNYSGQLNQIFLFQLATRRPKPLEYEGIRSI